MPGLTDNTPGYYERADSSGSSYVYSNYTCKKSIVKNELVKILRGGGGGGGGERGVNMLASQ